MASIKDAFQESLQDHNSLIKYIIFAIPVYYCVDLYSKNDILFWAVSAVVFVLLFEKAQEIRDKLFYFLRSGRMSI